MEIVNNAILLVFYGYRPLTSAFPDRRPCAMWKADRPYAGRVSAGRHSRSLAAFRRRGRGFL